MVVLKELGTDQTFKIIPRSNTADSMTIKEEGTTLDPVSYAISLTDGGYYQSITKTVTLEEGKTYQLRVLNGATEIYRDTIYCTNQTISDYSINNGVYEQHEGTFIVI